MRKRLLTPYLLFPVLLLAFAPGCQALHRYRPVTVLVRDAETKHPIAGAEVRISYPLTRASLSPYESVESTGEDGTARLRIAPFGDSAIAMGAAAKGYLDEELSVLAETIRQIKPAAGLKAGPPSAAPFVVELYAEPHPTVELIVPNGYRGVVKVEVQIQENASLAPGQRLFRSEVSSSGDARVIGPPLLRRLSSKDYRARYADGTPLGQRAEPSAVGLRWLRCEGSDQYFAVCTKAEYPGIRYHLHVPGPQESQSMDRPAEEQRSRPHLP